jgi:UDP-N-acetylglucosamine enolpyruvyl transferase
LTVNGRSIKITGSPNQTVPLLIGSLIVNEQISSIVNAPNLTSADVLVNARHLTVNGLANVVISSSHASVSCSSSSPSLQQSSRPRQAPLCKFRDHEKYVVRAPNLVPYCLSKYSSYS